ncbi:unnamed protein product [Moneuplotes crassus]|uniref:Uncharacterized protein n=1 Tax=Euplotes crassus TaxID=5936 RepID=A0AAD1UDA1_EUPCR|nr:unnamed protein product [Moneuplotes crassus]
MSFRSGNPSCYSKTFTPDPFQGSGPTAQRSSKVVSSHMNKSCEIGLNTVKHASTRWNRSVRPRVSGRPGDQSSNHRENFCCKPRRATTRLKTTGGWFQKNIETQQRSDLSSSACDYSSVYLNDHMTCEANKAKKVNLKYQVEKSFLICRLCSVGL